MLSALSHCILSIFGIAQRRILWELKGKMNKIMIYDIVISDGDLGCRVDAQKDMFMMV